MYRGNGPKHPKHKRIHTMGPWPGLNHKILSFSKLPLTILIKFCQYTVPAVPDKTALVIFPKK